MITFFGHKSNQVWMKSFRIGAVPLQDFILCRSGGIVKGMNCPHLDQQRDQEIPHGQITDPN